MVETEPLAPSIIRFGNHIYQPGSTQRQDRDGAICTARLARIATLAKICQLIFRGVRDMRGASYFPFGELFL